MRREKLVAQSSLLLGSYAFSVAFVSLVHELGHILAMYSIGITRIHLVINPLSESYASPLVSIPSESMLYVAASGMVFQFIVFTVLGAFLWKTREPRLMPLLICLPMSLINIGSYLLMGGIVEGSDVVLLVEAGAPEIIISIIGLVTLLSGFYSFSHVLSLTGMNSSESMVDIAAPILSATGIYGLAMLVYGYFSGYGTLIGVINLVSSVVMTIVFTMVFKRTGPAESIVELEKGTAFKILLLGVGVVVFCLLYF